MHPKGISFGQRLRLQNPLWALPITRDSHPNYTQRDCVQKIPAFLLLLLLIGFTGCEEKTPDDTPVPVENTTEIFPQQTTDSQQKTDPQEETGLHEDQNQGALPDTPVEIEPSKQEIPNLKADADTFTLVDTKGISYKITLSNEKVIFHDNTKPIILLNLFATWCPPCVGQLPYLNDLQKKHKKELFVTGILTHDSIDETVLKSFLSKNQISYFISNSPHNDAFANLLASTLQLPENFDIPLTAIYVNGQYFTHYEGVVPVEMIEYDLAQAKKQL